MSRCILWNFLHSLVSRLRNSKCHEGFPAASIGESLGSLVYSIPSSHPAFTLDDFISETTVLTISWLNLHNRFSQWHKTSPSPEWGNWVREENWPGQYPGVASRKFRLYLGPLSSIWIWSRVYLLPSLCVWHGMSLTPKLKVTFRHFQ